MPTAPDRTAVQAYIGTNGTYSNEAIDSALATEIAAQARAVRLPADPEPPAEPLPYPADLLEALLRRVQRLLEMRSKPLGYQDTATEFGVASSRVGPDPEIRRLEAPYRKLVKG